MPSEVHALSSFQWGEGFDDNFTARCETQILFSVLWQNQKSWKSSLLSQWRGIAFVISTEATKPDDDYKENITVLTEVEQNSN